MNKPRVTRWFKRSELPIRDGYYECFCYIAGGFNCIWGENLYWDGTGFLVRIPMNVIKWRGLTKESK